jgi:hypothetical protein
MPIRKLQALVAIRIYMTKGKFSSEKVIELGIVESRPFSFHFSVEANLANFGIIDCFQPKIEVGHPASKCLLPSVQRTSDQYLLINEGFGQATASSIT